jgi:DnaJ-class molecular chaperone
MAFKDYYRILGIKPDSGMKEIKEAYRRKASDFHPDKHPEKEPDARAFHEICEAYEVLGKPESRKEYDWKCRENEREDYGPAFHDEITERMGHSQFGQLFDDLLEEFLSGSRRTFKKGRRTEKGDNNIHYDDLTSGGSG